MISPLLVGRLFSKTKVQLKMWVQITHNTFGSTLRIKETAYLDRVFSCIALGHAGFLVLPPFPDSRSLPFLGISGSGILDTREETLGARGIWKRDAGLAGTP